MAALLPLGEKIGPDRVGQGAGIAAVGGMDDDPLGLVQRQHEGVLVQDMQFSRFRRILGQILPQQGGDLIPGRHDRRCKSRAAVHQQSLLGFQFSQLGCGKMQFFAADALQLPSGGFRGDCEPQRHAGK